MPGRGPRVRALSWGVIRSGACGAPRGCACERAKPASRAPRRAYSAWSGLALLGRCGQLISSSTRTGKGRVFKVCHAIGEFTRQHLAFRVERRMGAVDVIEMLDLAVLAHGAPQVLRADNGLNSSPEPWDAGPASTTHSKRSSHRANPGGAGSWSPLHNRMRDELPKDNMFEDLDHPRALIGAWSRRYNEEHPHSAPGWLSPNQYTRQ